MSHSGGLVVTVLASYKNDLSRILMAPKSYLYEKATRMNGKEAGVGQS